MVRLLCAGILFIAGLILSVISLMQGNVIVALSLVLAAMYVSLHVIIGINTALESPVSRAAATIISLISIISVFMYSRGLDTKMAIAHANAYTDFLSVGHKCTPINPGLHDLQKFGIEACMLQNNADQRSSIIELVKAKDLGPAISLVDSAISLSSSNTDDYCAIAFAAAEKLCPYSFYSLSEPEKELLRNEAAKP